MSDADPRNNAGKTRPGRRFAPGNPGRPKGARHKTTLAIEALLDGEAEGLTRKAVEMALAGNMVAMRLCLERLCPPRKDRPVSFTLPKIEGVGDIVTAQGALIEAVAQGEVTPSEAGEVSKLLESYARAVEISELAERIARLEARTNQ